MRLAFPQSSAAAIPSLSLNRPAQVGVLALGITLVGSYLLYHGQFNALSAMLFLVTLSCIALSSVYVAISLTFAYLLLLGDLRRLGDIIYGFPKNDLLILVPAVIAASLALPVLLRLKLDSPLVKAVFAFFVFMIFEIVNPRQGAISVGLQGAIFWIVPVLWFWIGLRYGDAAFIDFLLMKVVLPLSCLAAALGYMQTYIGFLPWEQAWIDVVKVHFHALGLTNGAIRAFGFSTNGEDFAHVLAIGCVISSGAFFKGRRLFGIIFLLIFPVLILTSIRNVFLKLVITVALQYAGNARGRGSAARLILFLALAAGAIAYGATQIKDTASNARTSTTQAALSHEAGAFTHPLDQKHSTLGIHAQGLVRGLTSGFISPIGYGLGGSARGADSSQSTTDKENSVGSSELDFSDAFLALGFPGGFLYLYIVYLVLRLMWSASSGESPKLSLSAFGVVLCGTLAWISTPGGYSIAPLFWFLIGSGATMVAAEDASENKTNSSSVSQDNSPVEPSVWHTGNLRPKRT